MQNTTNQHISISAVVLRSASGYLLDFGNWQDNDLVTEIPLKSA